MQCMARGFAHQLLVFSAASHLEVFTRWRQRLTCLPPECRLFEMQNEPHIPALGKQITLCKKQSKTSLNEMVEILPKIYLKTYLKTIEEKNIQTNLMIFFL